MTPHMMIHEMMMGLYNIGIVIRQYLAMESLWARQWKVYGQGNGKSMGKAMESL
jgi:hypothetical protein